MLCDWLTSKKDFALSGNMLELIMKNYLKKFYQIKIKVQIL